MIDSEWLSRHIINECPDGIICDYGQRQICGNFSDCIKCHIAGGSFRPLSPAEQNADRMKEIIARMVKEINKLGFLLDAGSPTIKSNSIALEGKQILADIKEMEAIDGNDAG